MRDSVHLHPGEEATKAAYFVQQPCVRAFTVAPSRKMESSSSSLWPIEVERAAGDADGRLSVGKGWRTPRCHRRWKS